jgi:hypothetical protein
MFGKLMDIWNNHGFELLLGLSVAFILIVGFYYFLKGKKGNFSTKVYIPTTSSRSGRSTRNSGSVKGKGDSKGETECRRVLEHLFRKPFNKARPDFLRNPVTGGNFNLELDCYNPNLRLAVEYNGAQHYKYIPYFHRNKEHFVNQKYRDDMKRRICREKGICLIEVPYTVKIKDIYSYLHKELKRNGYNV